MNRKDRQPSIWDRREFLAAGTGAVGTTPLTMQNEAGAKVEANPGCEEEETAWMSYPA